MSRTITVLPTREELFVTAANECLEIFQGCRQSHSPCTLALAGGSTPRGLYHLLATEPYRSQIPWECLRIYWGDERLVPMDHADSNYHMAYEALLRHVPISSQHIFRMEGELEPEEAARKYAQTIQEQFGLGEHRAPEFDLILLGMGADGHTASLFPGTTAVGETENLVAAPWVDRLQTYRVTLTPKVLHAAKHVIFLVSGKDKSEALRAVLEGPYEPDHFPAQVLESAEGHVEWLVDQEAATFLSSAIRNAAKF